MKQKKEPFPTIIHEGVSTLFIPGLLLCDSGRLDEYYKGASHGLDILRRLNNISEGEDICAQGIAVPVFIDHTGEYTVVVRHIDSEAYLEAPPKIVSRGWLLGTETGKLVLCGFDSLMFWDPWEQEEYPPRYVSCEIEPGWYRVELVGGINTRELDEGDDQDGEQEEQHIFEFVLMPVPDRPIFAADLGQLTFSDHTDLGGRPSISLAETITEHIAEGSVDEDFLHAALSRLNSPAFESFVLELFNDRDEPVEMLQDAGEAVFYKPLLDSYGGSLHSVFLLEYLPLALFTRPDPSTVLTDPYLTERLEKIRDIYKGDHGYFGMVSPVLLKAGRLRSIGLLTNLGGLDKSEYDNELIPKFVSLVEQVGLDAQVLVGSYDSFIDLNAAGVQAAFRRFLIERQDGISICLTAEGARVETFQVENSLSSGVLKDSRHPLEPIFLRRFKEKEQVLIEFEELINKGPKEAELERFLVAHYKDIFGTQYDRIETQLWLRFPELDVAGKDRRLDVFLRNSIVPDWELFEIKRVVSLTSTYRDAPVLAAEVVHSIQQVKNYSRILSNDSVKRRLAEEGIEYFEPSLNLVVGRRPQIRHDHWRWLLASQNSGVKLITFDDLRDEMSQRVIDLANMMNIDILP
ncbi:MAG: hypothetical protein AABN33_16215 [Acidobacteriota bacterium]